MPIIVKMHVEIDFLLRAELLQTHQCAFVPSLY